jgi:hypothetical protein
MVEGGLRRQVMLKFEVLKSKRDNEGTLKNFPTSGKGALPTLALENHYHCSKSCHRIFERRRWFIKFPVPYFYSCATPSLVLYGLKIRIYQLDMKWNKLKLT